MLTIRLYGDPILREKAAPIAEVTEEIRELAREMLVTMYREEGIGLAAPQVGHLKRLIVVDPDPEDTASRPLVLINPEIIEAEGEWVAEEGCLSLPDIHGDVPRAERIVVAMQTLDGSEETLTAEGWLGRVIQHEIDHLNGVLFIDHLTRMQRQRLRGPLRQLQRRAKAQRKAR